MEDSKPIVSMNDIWPNMLCPTFFIIHCTEKVSQTNPNMKKYEIVAKALQKELLQVLNVDYREDVPPQVSINCFHKNLEKQFIVSFPAIKTHVFEHFPGLHLATFTSEHNRVQHSHDMFYSLKMIPRGAFEVYFMDIRLFSKLENDFWPNIKKLVERCKHVYVDWKKLKDIQNYEIMASLTQLTNDAMMTHYKPSQENWKQYLQTQEFLKEKRESKEELKQLEDEKYRVKKQYQENKDKYVPGQMIQMDQMQFSTPQQPQKKQIQETPQVSKIEDKTPKIEDSITLVAKAPQQTVVEKQQEPQPPPMRKNRRGSIIEQKQFNKFLKQSSAEQRAFLNIAEKILPDQVLELKQMFNKLDKNGDGTISMQEIKKGLPDLEGGEAVFDCLRYADINGDGMICLSEFLTSLLDCNIFINDNYLSAAFNKFDKDKDGVIDKNELKALICSDELSFCLQTDPTNAEKALDEFDQDGDREISYQEFKDLVTKVSQRINANV